VLDGAGPVSCRRASRGIRPDRPRPPLTLAALEAFSEWAGRPPAGVWAAPGRVNLIGEHTDYNGGFVLPLAIDRVTRVAAAARDDRVLRCRSLEHEAGGRPGHGEEHPGWADYLAGVAWALAEIGVPVPGADLLVDTDLPIGAGLSSSAALEVAGAAALAALAAADVGPEQLAGVAHRAETEYVGVPSGVMDQTVVALGKAGHVLFLDSRSGHFDLVPFDPAAAGLSLVVVDTRTRRRLDDGRYGERRRECEEAARVLGVSTLRNASPAQVEHSVTLTETLRRRARHVVTENARVRDVVALLNGGEIAAIGPALVASHRSLRDDFEVSTEALDLAVQVALDTGAVGARMTGAGFGGCALALTAVDSVDDLASALTRAFEGRGFERPDVYPVTATNGVSRLA